MPVLKIPFTSQKLELILVESVAAKKDLFLTNFFFLSFFVRGHSANSRTTLKVVVVEGKNQPGLHSYPTLAVLLRIWPNELVIEWLTL